MGYAKAPWGACFLNANNSQLQPYTKLTPNLHQAYSYKAYKPYTKLTPNLHEAYSYILLQNLHQPYTKLTALRLSECCYTLLQNLHENYGSQLLTKS